MLTPDCYRVVTNGHTYRVQRRLPLFGLRWCTRWTLLWPDFATFDEANHAAGQLYRRDAIASKPWVEVTDGRVTVPSR